ncbi:MAG: hypothetical protein ACOWWR_10995 [Eubacteriales bacterium]
MIKSITVNNDHNFPTNCHITQFNMEIIMEEKDKNMTDIGCIIYDRWQAFTDEEIASALEDENKFLADECMYKEKLYDIL